MDTIWRDFQKNVENAGLTCGVIRATHYEGTGIVRRGRGYGFVFTRGDDGEWRPDNDSKRVPLLAEHRRSEFAR